ncbi:30S ribosome-binding factor RbfA [Chloroflexota bacterium]
MGHRIERINHLILREISELLRCQVKDPRLGTFITITEVLTSPDLKHARVLVSSVHGEGDKEEILSALVTASGFLRNELSKRLKLRRIPDLNFKWDSSIEQGSYILELIDKVNVERISGHSKD